MRPRSPLVRRAKPRAISAKRRSHHPELRYSTIASPRKRVKAKNVARAKRELVRCYGSPERRAWIANQPCRVCGAEKSVNAHVGRRSGAGRKGDAKDVIALCAAGSFTMGREMIYGCHETLHRMGRESFERAFKVNLSMLAQVTEREWQLISGNQEEACR